MVELEQLVEGPERDVVDLFEIQRRVDLRGDALQDVDGFGALGSSAHGWYGTVDTERTR